MSADYVSVRPEDVAARGNSSAGNRVVQMAKRYLGTPYVYGGSSPSGFNCLQDLLTYVYKQLGYSIATERRTPSFPNGVAVSKSELQPGDLVMFKRAGSYYRSPRRHLCR